MSRIFRNIAFAGAATAATIGVSAQAAAPAAVPASPPAATAPYASAFDAYRSFSAGEVGDWRHANETVREIGGWRAYAREIQGGAAQSATPPSGAAPSAAPSPPASGQQEHHR